MVEMQNVQQSYPYEIAIVLFPENTKTFYKWFYCNGHQLLTKMASIKLDS